MTSDRLNMLMFSGKRDAQTLSNRQSKLKSSENTIPIWKSYRSKTEELKSKALVIVFFLYRRFNKFRYASIVLALKTQYVQHSLYVNHVHYFTVLLKYCVFSE